MSNLISLLGLQWGDEGKGKVVDHLAKDLNAAVRYQGGHNAGHTLIINGDKVVFHLLPSAICHQEIKCYLGRGVVVSLEALFEEIDDAKKYLGEVEDRLIVSRACSLIQSYHIKLDQLREKSPVSTTIGTTGRGIGTAYEDRVGRKSIRVQDLYSETKLKNKLEENLDLYNFIFTNYLNDKKEDINQVFDRNLRHAEILKPYVGNVIASLQDHVSKKEKILFEGAQGALLDVSLGTYPYVTSSNSSIGGIASGVGVDPRMIDYSLGIAKAYTTRVGEGPFPTELKDSVGNHIAQVGGEVGATTGRPRRCGWLDAVLLSHTVKLNGIDGICLTKIDVLDGLDEIKICIDYEGVSLSDLLETMSIEDVNPTYVSLPGWKKPCAGIRDYEELDNNAKSYIERVESLCGAPIVMISTGPRREDTIIRQYPL
tara:strand:+ start:2487 stop:3767 length:1281 start_codon:yes stop_codon:yes gene_type:complete